MVENGHQARWTQIAYLMNRGCKSIVRQAWSSIYKLTKANTYHHTFKKLHSMIPCQNVIKYTVTLSYDWIHIRDFNLSLLDVVSEFQEVILRCTLQHQNHATIVCCKHTNIPERMCSTRYSMICICCETQFCLIGCTFFVLVQGHYNNNQRASDVNSWIHSTAAVPCFRRINIIDRLYPRNLQNKRGLHQPSCVYCTHFCKTNRYWSFQLFASGTAQPFRVFIMSMRTRSTDIDCKAQGWSFGVFSRRAGGGSCNFGCY